MVLCPLWFTSMCFVSISKILRHYQIVNSADPPECSIKSTYIDNNRALICSAVANPDDVTFVWRKRVENYTIEVRPKFQDNLSSYVIPSNNFRSLRTYICYANNSVGESSFCEIDVPGRV